MTPEITTISKIKKVVDLKKTQIKFAFVVDGKGNEYKYRIPKTLINEYLIS